MKDLRQRINIIATFEIPEGTDNYNLFRRMVENKIKKLEKDLGSDAVLEFLALEVKTTDKIVRD